MARVKFIHCASRHAGDQEEGYVAGLVSDTTGGKPWHVDYCGSIVGFISVYAAASQTSIAQAAPANAAHWVAAWTASAQGPYPGRQSDRAARAEIRLPRRRAWGNRPNIPLDRAARYLGQAGAHTSIQRFRHEARDIRWCVRRVADERCRDTCRQQPRRYLRRQASRHRRARQGYRLRRDCIAIREEPCRPDADPAVDSP